VALVGELNPHQELGGGDGADRHIGVGGEHISRVGGAGVPARSARRCRGSVAPWIRYWRRTNESAEVLEIAMPVRIGRIGAEELPQLAGVVRWAGAMVAIARPRRTTVKVSPRCSTASSMSAKRLEASVAEISLII
jgi:hypothetical protein